MECRSQLDVFKNRYQAVFGHPKEEEKFCIVKEEIKHCSHVEVGFDEKLEDSFFEKDIGIDGYLHLNKEDKTMEIWQRKATMVLITAGNRRLLEAFSDSIDNSIPFLARASLVTVCWMSIGLHSLGNINLKFKACSILMTQLVESLNYDRPLEERILASFSLLSFKKGTDYFPKPPPIDKELLSRLSELSQFAVEDSAATTAPASSAKL
ncbi:unnamed protein product [Fraxinus pennsylvanica]|uniref:Putative E3 ubiquitin-protein ligase LIN ARM-like domain-containing protein n=1 Tax=Fraxinus pennsylvanica TaxID=56036 RepID=A0AAD2E458_9LAMI|nr:unnamed protein product [Fraxinus pennsylvanica]